MYIDSRHFTRVINESRVILRIGKVVGSFGNQNSMLALVSVIKSDKQKTGTSRCLTPLSKNLGSVCDSCHLFMISLKGKSVTILGYEMMQIKYAMGGSFAMTNCIFCQAFSPLVTFFIGVTYSTIRSLMHTHIIN